MKEQTEIGQRILATLIVNKGCVEHAGGYAIRRLHRLLAVQPASLETTRAAVYRMERHGLIMRDNRPSTNAATNKHGKLITRCYSICLMVETDQVEINHFYIEELYRAIERRKLESEKKKYGRAEKKVVVVNQK